MFDAIAGRYDLLNRLLSAGVDQRWRKRALRALSLTGRERLVDLCTGTADLAILAACARPGARRVIGIDFAAAMLTIARRKVQNHLLDPTVTVLRGDATRIPLRDASADALTIAFGIRNVENPSAACREIYRVLAPGGRLAVLEFSIPTAPGIRAAYLWYFNHVLPRIGRLVSRDDAAYAYLPASVHGFAAPDEFARILREIGFTDVLAKPLTLGIVCLFTGVRGR
jgi:demethylmenaquinone methyltransferase/2-methoxy-6-polyprenyl-1,4-benzoquinol methylase